MAAAVLARSRSFTSRYEQGIAHSTIVNWAHDETRSRYLTGALGTAARAADAVSSRTRRGGVPRTGGCHDQPRRGPEEPGRPIRRCASPPRGLSVDECRCLWITRAAGFYVQQFCLIS